MGANIVRQEPVLVLPVRSAKRAIRVEKNLSWLKSHKFDYQNKL